MPTVYQPSVFYPSLVLGSGLLLPASALILSYPVRRNERSTQGIRRQLSASTADSSTSFVIPSTSSNVSFSFSDSPVPSSTTFPVLSTFNILSVTPPPETTSLLSTASFPSASSIPFISSSASSNLLSTLSTIADEGPTNTGQPIFTQSSSSSVMPAIIGGVIGCLAALTIGALSILLFRRRRRRRRREKDQRKVEKPFGTEAGFHLAADPDSERDSVQPFITPPSVPPRLATEAPPSKTSLLPLLSSSSQNLSISSPSSAVSQQSLLDQLNMLRAQIQHVEELARINGVATSSISDDRTSEPPPEYAANATQQVNSERKTGDAILFPNSRT